MQRRQSSSSHRPMGSRNVQGRSTSGLPPSTAGNRNQHSSKDTQQQHQATTNKLPMSSFYCVLCKKNGESAMVYGNHKLRDENNQVVCPVLKQFTCPHCGVRGDHTSGYCALNPTRKSPPTTPTSGPRKDSRALTRTHSVDKSGPMKLSPPFAPTAPPPTPNHRNQARSLALPHFCRPNFHMDRNQFSALLAVCGFLKPEARLEYLYKSGYNLSRFQRIQQIILTWRAEVDLQQLLASNGLSLSATPRPAAPVARPQLAGSRMTLLDQLTLM